MRAVPFAAIDTLFLDAGNTLVGMDLELLRALLARDGVTTTANALDRAEAAARPVISSRVEAGRRSEGRDARRAYVEAILTALGTDDPGGQAMRLVDVLRREVPNRRLWSRGLPGIPAALERLRRHLRCLVVVSNSDGTVEQGLVATGLRPFFDAVIDSHVVGSEKPHPGIFAAALAAADADPERTLHVGDLYAIDVRGAWGAGLHAILLDPYDDWTSVDCERVRDVPALAARWELMVPGI